MGNQLGSLSTKKDTSTGSFFVPATTSSTTITKPTSASNSNDGNVKVKDEESSDSKMIEYGVSSMRGWRRTMEDAHITQPNLYYHNSSKNNNVLLPNHSLFAIMDGHAGTFASSYASQHLCQVLSQSPSWCEYATWYEKNQNRNSKSLNQDEYTKHTMTIAKLLLEQALKEAFVQLDHDMLLQHQHLQEQRIQNGKKKISHSSGTTATVVLLTPQFILCANAGDSRALFCQYSSSPSPSSPERIKYDVIPLSHDHKPSLTNEKARILHAGGFVCNDDRVDGILAVSRGLGDYEFKDAKLILTSDLGEDNNNNNNNNKDEDRKVMVSKLGSSQKVSPVPDVIMLPRVTQPKQQSKQKKLDNNEEKNGFVFVACDGVWDVYNNEECVQEILKLKIMEDETDIGLICEEMLDLSLARGSTDNLSALLIQFSSSCHKNDKGDDNDDDKDNDDNDNRREGSGGGGGGGGVMARRKRRLEYLKKMEKSNNNTRKYSTTTTQSSLSKQTLPNWTNSSKIKNDDASIVRPYSTTTNSNMGHVHCSIVSPLLGGLTTTTTHYCSTRYFTSSLSSSPPPSRSSTLLQKYLHLHNKNEWEKNLSQKITLSATSIMQGSCDIRTFRKSLLRSLKHRYLPPLPPPPPLLLSCNYPSKRSGIRLILSSLKSFF